MGLLYFDLYSSRMFRCSGAAWEAWNYSQLQNQMLKTEGVSDMNPESSEVENSKRERKDRSSCPEGELLVQLCCSDSNGIRRKVLGKT